MNQVTLLGNTGRAPVLHEANGGHFATFRLATTKRWTDDENQRHKDTKWHDCVLWRKDLAPFTARVGKGTHLLVHGELCYRQAERDGIKHTRAFVRVQLWRAFPPASTADPNDGPPDLPEPDDSPA